MTTLQDKIKTHTAHGWQEADTSHISNVPQVKTHALFTCPCGWMGWIPI